MYKKTKKLHHKARDFKIESMCSDLIDANPDTLFIVSKKFVVTPDKKLGKEIKGLPLVISTTPINELEIPSKYTLTESGELTTWCEEKYSLVRLVYSPVKFTDGEIKCKKISNLYLDIEKEDEIKKLKRYENF
jgi:hypothetical protein